ncbi:MAG: hypothetical protein IK131_09110 [Paludibacteraceae bacterium]|nr:hypothetical protein [Paludibacteraceae bacterium]MBR5374814.1 hypothetical protein [Paludibacteraceae bacterium]
MVKPAGNKMFFLLFFIMGFNAILVIVYIVHKAREEKSINYSEAEYMEMTNYQVEATDIVLMKKMGARHVYKAKITSIDIKQKYDSPIYSILCDTAKMSMYFFYDNGDYGASLPSDIDTLVFVFNNKEKEVRLKSSGQIIAPIKPIYYLYRKSEFNKYITVNTIRL